MMLARKDAAANECVEARIGIATRNVDTVVGAAVSVPLDRDPMRGNLRAKTQSDGETMRSNDGEANEADAGNGVSARELRPKGWRQDLAYRSRIDAIVHQQAAFDHTVEGRHSHNPLRAVRPISKLNRLGIAGASQHVTTVGDT